MKKLQMLIAILMVFTFVLTGCGDKKAPVSGSSDADKTSGSTVVSSPKTEAAQQEAAPRPSMKPVTEERTYYNFETDLNGWEIPMWAKGKRDYVGKDVLLSKETASKGDASLKLYSEFPGGMWSAGLVEIQQYLDMSRYRVVSADLYIPEDAPIGLKAKIILTVGDTWKFVEMSRSIPLVPGEWVTVTANIEPGSYDWKRVVPDEEFAQDVRKIAIRVESNMKPVYSGPIYIDNIRVGR